MSGIRRLALRLNAWNPNVDSWRMILNPDKRRLNLGSIKTHQTAVIGAQEERERWARPNFISPPSIAFYLSLNKAASPLLKPVQLLRTICLEFSRLGHSGKWHESITLVIYRIAYFWTAPITQNKHEKPYWFAWLFRPASLHSSMGNFAQTAPKGV